jgi:hypothetical protein
MASAGLPKWYDLSGGYKMYGVYDAAQSEVVLRMLDVLRPPHVSLFSEGRDSRMGAVAPYLVELVPQPEPGSILLDQLWGHHWAVYLKSRAGLDELRRHLRRFLMAEDDDRRRLFFRYYDPRVLRAYLPTCTAEEAKAFFGPIECYYCINDGGHRLHVFRATSEGVDESLIELAGRLSAEDARRFPKAVLDRM